MMQIQGITSKIPSNMEAVSDTTTIVTNAVIKTEKGTFPTKRSPSGYNLFFHMVRDDILLFHKDKSGNGNDGQHPIFSDKNEDVLNFMFSSFNPKRIEDAAIRLRTKPKRKHVKIDDCPVSFRALTHIVSKQWQNLLQSIKQMFLSQATAEAEHYQQHQQQPSVYKRKQKQQRRRKSQSDVVNAAPVTTMTNENLSTKEYNTNKTVVDPIDFLNDQINDILQDTSSVMDNTLDESSLYDNSFEDVCFKANTSDKELQIQDDCDDDIEEEDMSIPSLQNVVSSDYSTYSYQYCKYDNETLRSLQEFQKNMMMKKLQQQQQIMKDRMLQHNIMKKLHQQQLMMKNMYNRQGNSTLSYLNLNKMQKFQQLSLQNRRTMMMLYMQKQKQQRMEQQQQFQQFNNDFNISSIAEPTNVVHFNNMDDEEE